MTKYGWVPDLPDVRDHIYAAPFERLTTLPAKIDLRKGCPPVWNQLDLGSCTGQAIAAAHQFAQTKQKLTNVFTPSKLFIYYNERVLEGTVDYDSGASIRDGFKTIGLQGVCPESMWQYYISQFRTKPSAACYVEGLKHQAITYRRITHTLLQMQGCLAGGYPFVFGFTVYESFESSEVAETGIVPMPSTSEQALGGHAVIAVGYDNTTRRFIVRNSWGTSWGLSGYFTIPYNYLLDSNLADDFWTLRLVEI